MDDTVIQSGGTLDINGFVPGSSATSWEVVHVAGAGVGGNGAIINSGATQTTNAFRYITLDGDATVGGAQRFDLRAQGTPATATLDMGGYTLTVKTGLTGSTNVKFTLNNVTVTPGSTGNINVVSGPSGEGNIGVEGTTNLGGSAANTLTVNSGGRLSFYALAGVTPWTLNLNGGTVTTVSTDGRRVHLARTGDRQQRQRSRSQ